MPYWIKKKQDVAAYARTPVFLVAEADGYTPVTGMVGTATLEILTSDGSFVAALGTFTEVGNGLYYYEFTTDETNVDYGMLTLLVTGPGNFRPYVGEVFVVAVLNYTDNFGCAIPGSLMGLANSAITSAKFAASAVTATALAAGCVTSAKFAAGAIDAAAIATDAITSAELAGSAVNEIRDAILSDSTPFQGARIDAAISSRADAVTQTIIAKLTRNRTKHAGSTITVYDDDNVTPLYTMEVKDKNGNAINADLFSTLVPVERTRAV